MGIYYTYTPVVFPDRTIGQLTVPFVLPNTVVESIAYSLMIPGMSMGPNDSLLIDYTFGFGASAGGKNIAAYFGCSGPAVLDGFKYANYALTGVAAGTVYTHRNRIWNNNSISAQTYSMTMRTALSFDARDNQDGTQTSAIATAASIWHTLTVTKATAADVVTLLYASVKLQTGV